MSRTAWPRIAALLTALFTAALLQPVSHAAEEPKPVDLLRLPAAKVESTTAPGGDGAALKALTDGDAETLVEVDATAAAPLEIVYGFGGGDVAPESVRVTLPAPGKSDAPAARVEVLVSTVSPHAGFRSARADPLKGGAKPETFEFLPLAAKWILVRLSPAPGAKRVAVAEVSVLGREGPPESRYAFAESPAKALDVLARLEKASSLKVAVSADEKAMFARARAGRLDAKAFAEAALLASGVLDSAERARYLAKLDVLEVQARAAVKAARGPEAQGEALLQWLHKGPMAKGYVSHQTDLSKVLDTGTFNCVSSAALFNCLALRLGLDARAIEVPTHAFSIVYDGTKHMDVETTGAGGFNPARDPAAVAKFEATTGFRYIQDIHRDQRREVEEAGLAAIIYYNHGVMLADAKRYHEALLAFFRAMSLDAEFDSAVKGGLGVLANWGMELERSGKPEEALEVVGTGLALAPKDAALVNNRLVIWERWAEREIDAGRADEALAILKRAAAAVPDSPFAGRQAWVFLKPAEKHADAGRWEEALAAASAGLAKLEGAPKGELTKYRAGLYARWFAKEIRAKRFEAAAVVLEKGLAAEPGQAGLVQNTGYLAQEWAKAEATKDPAKALVTLRALRTRFPGNEGVVDAGAGHVRRSVYEQVEAKRWQEALAAVEQGKDLVASPKDVQHDAVYVFDHWAKDRMKAGAWAEAADVYAQARARFPDEGLVKQNIAYLAQEWSKAAYKSGGAAEAARVTKVLTEKFPGVEFAAKSSANELKRAVNELMRAGKHAEALKALEEGKELLVGETDADTLWVAVYDDQAKDAMKEGRWAEAADVYAAALVRLPGQHLLENNIGYMAQEWARTLAGKGDHEGAIAGLRAMRTKFPASEGVAESAKRHVMRAVREMGAKGKPEEALAALDSWKDLLPQPDDLQEAAVPVYDGWAEGLADAKSWQEAVDVYAKGLARFPESGHLRQNAVATWYQWAKSFSDQKKWDEAIAIYDKGLERMPDTSLFKQNKAWCEAQKKK